MSQTTLIFVILAVLALGVAYLLVKYYRLHKFEVWLKSEFLNGYSTNQQTIENNFKAIAETLGLGVGSKEETDEFEKE